MKSLFRAMKAFSFIQQAVNLLGKVGTSLFFRAPRYSALASRIKSLPEGSESVSVHPAGSESARQGWNESVFPPILTFHPCRQNEIFTQRAAKAFSFIRQAVNPLGKVGTSPFFHAPRYSALAESNLYSEGSESVFVYPAGSESARQGWNESVFPCTSIFRPCK